MAKKANSILHVSIDSKEQKFVKKSQAFFDKKGIKNTVKPLTEGDLRITLKGNKKFIVERKRYDDFASSYVTNHIQDQAIRMNEKYDYYCCIVHGSMSDIYKAANYNPALKRIKEPTIHKMHQKLELIYKLPCFFVEKDVQYFTKIMELSDMIVKSDSINLVKTNATIKEYPELSFLMVGSSIGEKTARKLINEFESPQNVFNASRNELLKVDGVGDTTIAKIKELKEVFENGQKNI